MLVEDSQEYRDVIQFALEDDPRIELVNMFGTAELALRSLKNEKTRAVPDVMLLDLNLPGISGINALPEFIKLIPESKILILTQSECEADLFKSLKLGAVGYLLKSSSVQALRSGIEASISGGASIDPSMARYFLDNIREKTSDLLPDCDLSEREVEILRLVSQGLARKEIAESLSISPKTVANHIAHIFEKLKVPNAPAAITKAHQVGLLGGND